MRTISMLGRLGRLVVFMCAVQLLFHPGVCGAKEVRVLVDDYAPQPVKGDASWYYNRLGGDRGSMGEGGTVTWGNGEVTAALTQSGSWAGVWTSMNHPNCEMTPINFSSIFPAQILPQGHVTGIRVQIEDGKGNFKVELKDTANIPVWFRAESLSGGERILEVTDLPLIEDKEVQMLNWIIEGDHPSFVKVSRVELIVDVPDMEPASEFFLWSYSQLLRNWNAGNAPCKLSPADVPCSSPTLGLTRDRANFPYCHFDNISASGLQAAAAVMACSLEFISVESARDIVEKTTVGVLSVPRCHGLLPHFIQNGDIVPKSEWSSLDTVITFVALIEARQALGLDTAPVEKVLREIDWNALLLSGPNVGEASISHGYLSSSSSACSERIHYGWDSFGTETWMANLGYAAATCKVALMDASPAVTYNGSGFIDELAWLFVPAPEQDRWGIRWNDYRAQAAQAQLSYYLNHPCYGPLGLFGLSAAEVPDPSIVDTTQIYQAFGVGGKASLNDGTDLLGHAVVVPHYAAMIASEYPDRSTSMWKWFVPEGLLSPLNNVESSMFIDEGTCERVVWNSLKGSWNLGLQTLGWGRLLTGTSNPLYEAMQSNATLRKGYLTMVLPSDLNEDGVVDERDLFILFAQWHHE